MLNVYSTFEQQKQGGSGETELCFAFSWKIHYSIFEANLKALRYRQDEVSRNKRCKIYLQQDGVPAHNSATVANLLKEHMDWYYALRDLQICQFLIFYST